MEKPKFVVPPFLDNPIITKTIIAHTPWKLNIDKLYSDLPITPYVFVPKKRGRKKKSEEKENDQILERGAIITIKYKNSIRGTTNKKEKREKRVCDGSEKIGKKLYFRNSMTIVMVLDKNITFKISKNGSFQFTGCKYNRHAEECMKKMWEYICKTPEFCDNFSEVKDKFDIIFTNGMRNVKFSLGFSVDKIALNDYFNERTQYFSHYEPIEKYPGVSIKFPAEDGNETKLVKLNYIRKKWKKSSITYGEYLASMNKEDQEKEEIKKQKKPSKNTFFVFDKGNVNISGKYISSTQKNYYIFWEIIQNAYKEIKKKE